MTGVPGSPLSALGLRLPVLAAPMAGGPTTPALVTAAAAAGSLGFLAAGYKAPETLAVQMAEVRASRVAFGVNVFAPNPVPVDPGAYREYALALQPEADRYGVDLRELGPQEDDDHWRDKIDLLLAEPVAVVSFTFGIPAAGVVAALRKAGTVVLQTVTSAAEATRAIASGADMLAVQGAAAGGHSGTLTPGHPPAAVPLAELVAEIAGAVDRPLIAAGGLAEAGDVAAVLQAGADAAMVGTALLLADESGTSVAHRSAL
ncbi:MAG TPA: nitronate monooxygenase, partial [Acidimicrobiales bacterium]|nr:nitronate monooxygenase [Acidimicrobiales bacterium]